jgi:hypothetical protein
MKMKPPLPKLVIATMCIAATFHSGSVLAQAPPGQPPPARSSAPLLSSKQLQDLVGRIALYPDDLVALVLPASTTPLDIVKAQRFLAAQAKDKSRKPDASISQPVVNLLTYPDVIAVMGNDLDWTEALGDAVTAQQVDVLQAIQIFRRIARDTGNLKTDDKQIVIVKQDVVTIVPAKPEVIYVPIYQPAKVVVVQAVPAVTYVATPYPLYYHPVATTTVAVATAAAVAYGLNWAGGAIYHAPYAAHYGQIQDQRMDYANNAREDWQDYSRNSQNNRQDAASQNQSSRQQTSTTNQAQRQDSASSASSANQSQRQQSASNAQSQAGANQSQRQQSASGAQSQSAANQSQRQSGATGAQQGQRQAAGGSPQGAQNWQGGGASHQGGQAQGAKSGSSGQFGGRQSSGGGGGGAFGGMSSGSKSQSFSQRGGQSRSGGSRSGGGRRRG